MAGNLGKSLAQQAALWALLLAPLFLSGCSTSGSRFTLFPSGHPLLDSARDLRLAAGTDPLPLPRELDKRVLPLYVVEPGDTLSIQPVNLDANIQLPGDQPVLLDGTVNLGRYGLLVVAGKTVPEIEQLVRAHLQAQARDAKDLKDVKDVGPIVVRVVARVSKVYYVLGDVNNPGAFPLQGRETVLDGIIAAGGLTDRASRKNIILDRPTAPHSCRVVLPICYLNIVQLGDTTTNYQLAPGDRIYVATRSFWDRFCRKNEKALCTGCQTACPLAPGDAPALHPHTAEYHGPVTVGQPVADPAAGERPAPPAPAADAVQGASHRLPATLPPSLPALRAGE